MAKQFDLNTASEEELMRIPEFNVGRVRQLLQTRRRLGGFRAWEDVKQAPGFSNGMIRRLQEAGFTLRPRRRAA